MKKLSLIILTYNSEKDIYDCLDSVYKYNDIGDSLEIIVVDNNSDNYIQMQKNIMEQYPDVQIIANQKNGGYGQGNNLGIKVASAPIISIMTLPPECDVVVSIESASRVLIPSLTTSLSTIISIVCLKVF